MAKRKEKEKWLNNLKFWPSTVAVGTSNNSIGGAKLVRLLNSDTFLGLVTLFDTISNTQIGTVQLAPNEVFNLKKRTTEVLTANNATKLLATPISSV